MKKLTLALAALVLLLAATPLLATDAQTLQGEFVWERPDRNISGPLEAVFQPTGDDTWNVTFTFDWEDEVRVWSGTAEGSLEQGQLAGRVSSDQDRPTPWEFRGTFGDDGSFEGIHAVIDDGESRATGTLTLAR